MRGCLVGGRGGALGAFLLIILRLAAQSFLLALGLSFSGIFLHVANDHENGALLQVVLNLVEIAEAALHTHQTQLVVVALAHLVAAPGPLDLHDCVKAPLTISLRLNSKLAESAPEALDFDCGDVANVANQAEPSEVLLLAPPALDTNSSLCLPDREHLAAHEQFNTVGVELVDDFVTLLLVE